MAALSVNDTVSKRPRNPDAEKAVRNVLSEWKTNFVSDACHAAKVTVAGAVTR
jgi:hypothetical protein